MTRRTAIEVQRARPGVRKPETIGAQEGSADARRVKVAIVGVGIAGESHLLDGMTSLALEIVALCAPRSGPLDALADRYGVSGRYASLDELLAREPDCDAVVLATPPEVLAAQLEAVVAHGKAVIVEKPGALRAAELHAYAQGARAVVAYNRRYRHAWHTARKWMREGWLRGVIRIEARWRGPYAARYASNAPTHRARLHGVGRGVLLDTGSHVIDAVHFVTGRAFTPRQCLLQCNDRGIDVAVHATLRDEHGTPLTIEIDEGDERILAFEGPAGRIVVDDSGAYLDTPDRREHVDDDILASPVEDATALVHGGRAPFGASLQEACEVLATLEGLYRLAGGGRPRSAEEPRARPPGSR